jgi:large subunit ribosomal protein L3
MSGTLLGKKLRMTQYFDDTGRVVPVTIVQAGPCPVVQVKSPETDGYSAIQIGYDDQRKKVAGKPRLGHFAKANVEPKKLLKEIRLAEGEEKNWNRGDLLTVELFEPNEKVDVIGRSKGCGFAGTVKRHGFSIGPKTHGSHNKRRPGSIVQSATPSKVLKGVRMAGQMGNVRCTTKHLRVVKIDTERNLLFIRGTIPGPTGGHVIIRTSKS